MKDYESAFDYLADLSQREPQKEKTFNDFIDYLGPKGREKGIPLTGQFELTPLCSFDCRMCYTHLTREQMRGRASLSADQWKGLMREAWEAGMFRATLTGGECLTYPGFEELCLYLKNLGCVVDVMTNGELLDEKWIEFFKAHKPASIQITLYGGDEDTYERVTGRRVFGTVSDNIRRALDADLPIELCVTPSRYMGKGVFDAIRVAKSFPVRFSINSFLIEPKEETGRAGQEHDVGLEDYVKIYRLHNELTGKETVDFPLEKLPPFGGPYHRTDRCGVTCNAGMIFFTIEWDGKMYACNSIREIWAEPMKDGFSAAWDSIHKAILRWPVVPECIECPYESVCTNCPAEKARFAQPGKPPLKLCEKTRYLVQHGVRSLPACE